jgi:hypothetical protein
MWSTAHVHILSLGTTNLSTALWNVTQCSLVGWYQCFEGTCSLHLQGSSVLETKQRKAVNSVVTAVRIPHHARACTVL